MSTRAAAESAARAGYDVTAIDAFADLDQHDMVRALSVPRELGRPFTAARAAAFSRRVECDIVAYLSPFENHPRAVETLARGRTLWGSAPDVLARVRDPGLVMRALEMRGVPALEVLSPATSRNRPGGVDDEQPAASGPGRGGLTTPRGTARVVKPLRSGGGRGIRPWRDGLRIPRGCYLQERVDGVPGSVVFVAAAGRVVLLATTRQLIGERAFGAGRFEYCGSIVGPPEDAQFGLSGTLREPALRAAQAIAEEFDLAGLNTLDFVAAEGVPYVVEVNPRWSGSMELVERAAGLSLFSAHARACASGLLPDAADATSNGPAVATGKAIVFARAGVVIGDTLTWLGDSSIRDVPRQGERIGAGQPVCTVFASGRDADDCHAALVARAGRVYEELDGWGLTSSRRAPPLP